MSVASTPSQNLSQLLTFFRDVSRQNSEYLLGQGGVRRWMVPPGVTTLFPVAGKDPFLSADKPFHRGSLNAEYADAVKNSRGAHDAVLSELYYLAALGRSFILRHQTTAQQFAQAAGRAAAHGHEQGVWAQLLRYFQSLREHVKPPEEEEQEKKK